MFYFGLFGFIGLFWGFSKPFDSWSENKFTALTAYLLGYQKGIKLASSHRFGVLSVCGRDLGKMHIINYDVFSCHIKLPH